MPEIFENVPVQFGLVFDAIHPGTPLQCRIKALQLAVREGGKSIVSFTLGGVKYETSFDTLIWNSENWKVTKVQKGEQTDAQKENSQEETE